MVKINGIEGLLDTLLGVIGKSRAGEAIVVCWGYAIKSKYKVRHVYYHLRNIEHEHKDFSYEVWRRRK